MNSFLSKISSSRHFRFGVPFFLFIFGGQQALSHFRAVRYDSRLNPNANKTLLTPEEAFGDLNAAAGGKKLFEKSNKTAEEELDILDKKVDWYNWENKRGPRPWENSVEKREVKRIAKGPVSVKELLGE